MSFKDIFSKNKNSGKSFAAAVAVCLLIIAGAGVYSYTKVSDKLNSGLAAENLGSAGKSETAVKQESQSSGAAASQTAAPAAKEKVTAPVTVPPETAAAYPEAEDIAKSVNAPAEGVEKDDVLFAPAADIFSPAAGAMVRPLNGEVLCDFSGGELVKSATLNVWKTHDGVDIAGNPGEKVKSMTAGTVSEVYEDQMMGVCVVIDHGSGINGYYCNLEADVPVTKGQDVSAGTIIGTVGNTADSELKEASHLHFALRKNGEWLDPIALISGEGS